MRELTATSYAILGFLCLRPWSTYELARQMDRSYRWCWPRARSGIYNEPKKLVEHGLAKAKVEHHGRRARTVYSATPAGRKALRRWLSEPSAEPLFESEAFVRIGCADFGTVDQLVATVAGLRKHAEQLLSASLAQAQGYLDSEAPFPERRHVQILLIRFINEYWALLLRWSRWAEEEVNTWDATTEAKSVEELQSELRSVIATISPIVSSKG
jgi:PadR family transcriptional regulator, regulatory protein AphA